MLIELTPDELAKLSIEELLLRYRRVESRRGTGFTKTLAELEAYLAEARRRDALAAALERTPGGVWVPIPDDEYPMTENAENSDDFLYVFGNNDPNVCAWVEFQDDSVMLDLGMKICRLVQQPAPAQEVRP